LGQPNDEQTIWSGQQSNSNNATVTIKVFRLVIADLQKMAVAEWLQSFNSVRGPMERLGSV